MKLKDNLYMIGSGAFGISHSGDCHVYALDCSPKIILIDAGCGDDTELILNNLKEDGLDPSNIAWVLVTHAHRDHAGGCIALKNILNNKFQNLDVKFAASPGGAELLQKGTEKQLGLDLFGIDKPDRDVLFPRFQVDQILGDENKDVEGKITVGGSTVYAVSAPGHSLDSQCYYVETNDGTVLFSGDVITSGGYISYGNWPDSDLSEYRITMEKLILLNVEVLLPGHLLWTLKDGRVHIKRASDGFKGLFPPAAIHQLP